MIRYVQQHYEEIAWEIQIPERTEFVIQNK
jgi:hypothetical protein